MKATVKKLIPQPFRFKLRVVRERLHVRKQFALDRKRYLRNMLPSDGLVTSGMPERNREAQVTKDYHRVEKGLALPAPKRPFGDQVAARLKMLRNDSSGSDFDDYAGNALTALAAWNDTGTIDETVSPRASNTSHELPNPEDFFGSRHSTRNFSDAPVDNALLERATQLAISSPSVCNRQPWQVRYFSGAEAVEVLKFQNGNSGFRENIPVVALITVDERLFSGPAERNQAWIEGGIFSMSLALGFHALGIETCMLNMSVENSRADALRALEKIDSSELVVMMMAIGYGAVGHRRARSPRRDPNEVLRKLP